jgi:hypothetical protein
MRTETALIIEALEEIGSKPISAPEEFLTWLTSHHIPPGVTAFLQSACLAESADLGVIHLSSFSQIMRYHTEDPTLLESQFLQVGGASNGDPVVIDLLSGTSGYLSHELLWEGDPAPLRDNFRVLAPTIGELVKSSMKDDSFPIDWHDAVS